MGAVSWPALSDARITKSSEPLKPNPALAAGPKVGAKSPPASHRSAIQGTSSEPLTHSGGGNIGTNSSTPTRHKPVKRGITGNGIVTPFSAHGASENVSPWPSDQPVKGSYEKGMKADTSRVFHHRGEGVGHFSNNAGQRRNNMRDQGRGNFGWNSHGRGYWNGRDNGLAFQQHRVGPRNLPRPTPPFINTYPGFFNAAGFQNAGGVMYYMPAVAPDPSHAATYFVAPGHTGMPMHGPDPMALRLMLMKQIEYYFSVENLCRDIYLRKVMDHQGFVPVSVIASFNRVRMLAMNPSQILDALRFSTVVEVQGDRVRKRDDWAKWILPSKQHDSTSSRTSQEGKKEIAKSSTFLENLEHDKIRPDRVDDECDGSSPLPVESRPHCAAGLQQSSVYMGSSCTPDASGGDVERHAGPSERYNESERDKAVTSSFSHVDVEAKVKIGCPSEWSGCLTSNDTSSLEESSRNCHLIAEEREEHLITVKSSLPGKEGDPFQDDELETQPALVEDARFQSQSYINADDDDSEVNDKDVQQPGIITQAVWDLDVQKQET